MKRDKRQNDKPEKGKKKETVSIESIVYLFQGLLLVTFRLLEITLM